MKSLYLPLIAVLLGVFGLTMLQAGKQSQLAQMRQAYSTCWTAHNEINGSSEDACGHAQETTHTEFVCGIAGSYCWLEVK